MKDAHPSDEEKQALIQRLIAVQKPAFFEQLRILLDQFQAPQLENELTEADHKAIAEGREDVAAGRVESWEDFRKFFAEISAPPMSSRAERSGAEGS